MIFVLWKRKSIVVACKGEKVSYRLVGQVHTCFLGLWWATLEGRQTGRRRYRKEKKKK